VANKKALTLTFVNSLVEDLALELRGLSEVKTLHGFARGILYQAAGSVQVFPLLSRVIGEDFKFHKGSDINFDKIFNDRDDGNENIPFYKSRQDYYRHNGHTDLIFAAVKLLEKHANRIPKFDLVLVDEFQDFNKLEVSLINLLSKKNQILIAGDDDQALYFFKDASPVHIRARYNRELDDYTPFTLIHCSRCTKVIVDAFNDVIEKALAQGFLKDRVAKKFLYFEDKRRAEDTERYSKLVHILSHSGQVPYAIERELDRIALDIRDQFSTLVIVPTKNQCRSVVKGLRHKGFRNVSFVDREEKTEPELLDGMVLLLGDKDSNLGWRILARAQLPDAEFAEILEKSIGDPSKKFYELVSLDYRKKVRRMLAQVRKISKGRVIPDDDCDEVFQNLGMAPLEIAKRSLRDKLEDRPVPSGTAGLRDLPIKVTTVPGAKGLSEDYVFIAHFDDRFFLDKESKVTDQNICNLLVALTRARKKMYLISCQQGEPKFLSWISKSRIESIDIRNS
jgi:superfamily I DNA/RNA helicase